jgi:hypothetical protein
MQVLSALYCVLFVLDASVPPDQPRLPVTSALAWYLCAPFFAGYLVLGVAVADDPLGFLVSGHAVWDLASFVPCVVASMPWAAASVLAALGVTYGEVSGFGDDPTRVTRRRFASHPATSTFTPWRLRLPVPMTLRPHACTLSSYCRCLHFLLQMVVEALKGLAMLRCSHLSLVERFVASKERKQIVL